MKNFMVRKPQKKSKQQLNYSNLSESSGGLIILYLHVRAFFNDWKCISVVINVYFPQILQNTQKFSVIMDRQDFIFCFKS